LLNDSSLALNGSFTIFYFLGEFDKETPPEKLGLAPTFVGETHVFTAPIEACDNCGRQEEQATLVTSTTPFTAMLLDYEALGVLDSLRPEHVKPFLVKNLRWRVVGVRISPPYISPKKEQVQN
jgi:tyrosinase